MPTPRLSMAHFLFQVTDDQIQITEDPDTEAEELGGSIGPSGSGKYKLKGATNRLTSGFTGLSAQTLNASDIMIEYHPHSERDTCILSPKEFKASLSNDLEPTKPPDNEPWRPFHSREDFEFAELVRDAALNWTQIDRLIKLVQHYQDPPGSFTFRGYNDLNSSPY